MDAYINTCARVDTGCGRFYLLLLLCIVEFWRYWWCWGRNATLFLTGQFVGLFLIGLFVGLFLIGQFVGLFLIGQLVGRLTTLLICFFRSSDGRPLSHPPPPPSHPPHPLLSLLNARAHCFVGLVCQPTTCLLGLCLGACALFFVCGSCRVAVFGVLDDVPKVLATCWLVGIIYRLFACPFVFVSVCPEVQYVYT